MEVAMRRNEARPTVKSKRAAQDAHMGPKAIIRESAGLRTWAPHACIALGWALTAALCGLMAAGVEVWAVFEIGFAAAVLFGVGIGMNIAEELDRHGRR